MVKKLIYNSRYFGLCLIVLLTGNYSVFPQTQSKNEQIPRVERGECAVAVPVNEKADCGYLVVFEDRNTNRGRTIRLPFIVMKSDSATPLPDPILFTGGGPGSSSLGPVRNRKYIPYLKNRDYVLFEQRGTKYAQPSLECPEVNDAQIDSAKKNLTDKDSAKAELKAVRVCREKLLRAGINLSAYNSAASAADIEDLRRLLGYEKWNLYGISYSTRLMLTILRYYPNGVRSVVLDSVLPPSVGYDETSVDGVMRALNAIFASCKADAECNTAFPNLEKQFYALVEKLDKKPILVDATNPQTKETIKVRLTGSDVVNSIYSALEDSGKLSYIPFLIGKAAENDEQALKAIAKTKVELSNFTWGMRYSVWCSEEMPFQNRGLIKDQTGKKYPNLKGFGIQTTFPQICDIWKVKPTDKIENTPVKSDIPTLILAGEYDPDTPPNWGKLAAQTLPNSYFYELPAMTHVPTFSSSCAQELTAAFFDNPKNSPDSQCVKKMSALKFVITIGK